MPCGYACGGFHFARETDALRDDNLLVPDVHTQTILKTILISSTLTQYEYPPGGEPQHFRLLI